MLTLLALLLLALSGLCVALTVRAVALPRMRASARVDEIARYGFVAPVDEGLIHKEEPRSLVRALGRLAAARLGSVRINEMRHELQKAGMYDVSPHLLLGWRMVAAVAVPLTCWMVGAAFPAPQRIALVVFGALVGWTIPMTIVRARGRRRIDEIDLALPDLIDLLVVSMETGLGFSGAMQMTAARLRGPLAEEVRLTLQEEQMGLSMSEALGHMLERVDIPSVRTFVRSVIQAETLGVSIGQIMRNLAVEMRKTRRAAAEERAQKAATKMLFPLIFLIFPALFVIILGPGVISIVKTLGGAS